MPGYRQAGFARLIVREEHQSLARRFLLVTTYEPPVESKHDREIALSEISETNEKNQTGRAVVEVTNRGTGLTLNLLMDQTQGNPTFIGEY